MSKTWELLNGITKASKHLLSGVDHEQAMTWALAALADAARVERVGVYENTIDARTGRPAVSQRYEWDTARGEMQIENPTLQLLPADMLNPDDLAAILRGEAVAGAVERLHPVHREHASQRGVVSCIMVPILLEWEIWGFLTLEDCSEHREWGETELMVLDTAAGLIGNAIARYRAIARLQQNEERFRNLAELTGTVIWETDLNGVITYISPACEHLYGYKREELIARNVSQFIHPDDVPEVMEMLATSFATATIIVPMEYRVIHRSGQIRWTMVRTEFVRNDLGSILGLKGIAVDITEQRQADIALKESEAKYRALASNIPGSNVVLFDRELKYLLIIGKEHAPLGIDADYMIGKTCFDVYPQEIAELVARHYRAALSGTPQRFEIEAEGYIFRLQALPVLDDKGALLFGMAIAQNITQERLAERALKLSEERYRVLSENITGAGVALFDHSLSIILAAGSEYQRLGMDPGSMIGRRAHNLLPPEIAGIAEDYMLAALAGQTCSWELDYKNEVLLIQMLPIRDESGQTTYGMAIFQNITEHKRFEQLAAEHYAAYIASFNAAPSPLVLYDLERERFAAVNLAAQALLGYSEQEILANPEMFSSGIPQYKHGDLRKLLEQADPAKSSTIKWQARHAVQRKIWVSITLTPIKIDGRAHMLGYLHPLETLAGAPTDVVQYKVPSGTLEVYSESKPTPQ